MNKVFLSGFAIKDFELRQVNGNNGTFNTVKGSINVRRERAKKDPNTGFYPSDLIDLEASGGTADILAGVQKGDKVTIVGSYRIDPYTGRDNQQHFAHKVRVEMVDNVQKATPKQQNQQPVNNQNVGGMIPTPAPQQTMVPPTTPVANVPTGTATQQTAPQQTIPNGTFNTPAGMPAGQGMPSAMPDFGALDGMPNFADIPFA